MSGDPAAFLAAQLDKLEATAHEVLPQRSWKAGPGVVMPDALTSDDERIWVLDDDYKHNTLVADERFVLDLVAAHRAILTKYQHASPKAGAASFDVSWGDGMEQLGWVVRLLAQAYGWTPEEDRAER